jgi:hypothetical protein
VQDDDLVKLRFDLPDHGDLTVWGNVVFWVKDTGFGVRFSAFSQGGARDRLAEWLSSPPASGMSIKNPGYEGRRGRPESVAEI